MKKLFTFGCSFTKDNYQDTWADLLAQDLNLELHNHAERGAGADYVGKRILTSDIGIDDLVVIMWPSADRYDLWADRTTPHLLQDYVHASWPDGTQPQLVDLHGQAQLDQGYILNGSVPRGYKHKYFKYFYSPYQAVHNWYTSIITAQLYLAAKGVSYHMMTALPFDCPINYHHGTFTKEIKIVDHIDLSKFSDVGGFLPWAISTSQPFLNAHYPATIAHQQYIDTFLAPLLKNA